MATTYAPKNINDFVSVALSFNGVGLLATPTAQSITNVDYTAPFDILITGAVLMVKNATFGDSITFQVVDVNGILTPPDTVLNQFVTNWYLVEDSQKQFEFQVNYPAKIYGNLVLRLIYNSVGEVSPSLAVNYITHKVLT